MTGIDASAKMAAAARARGIAAEEGSAESLPYADRSFDAVFSNAVLHWVRGQDAMMVEVKRVLKPGGRFVADWAATETSPPSASAFAAVLARLGHAALGDRGNYYPTADAYARRLAAHGFTVERMILFPRPTPLGNGGMTAWLNTFCRGALDAPPKICGKLPSRKPLRCSRRHCAMKKANGTPIMCVCALP